MIRKLLIFIVLFAAGFYLLTVLNEGPIWKKSGEEEDARVTQTPTTGVTVESTKPGQIDKPQVRVSGTGALTLKGSPITYKIGSGAEMDLPSYVLTARNHRIRNDGVYDLDEVRVDFLRPTRKGRTVVQGSPVYLTATSMRVTVETVGQVQRLDQSQEMDFTGLVVHSRLARMRKDDILEETETENLMLESNQISGSFRDEVLDLSTKDAKEPVTITLKSRRGDLKMTGLGVSGVVQTGPLAKKEMSEIRLLEQVSITGSGDYDLSVSGKGPLVARGGRALPWFVELDREIRISIAEKGRPASSGIQGEGDKLRIWVGFTELLASGEASPGRSLSDVSLQGRPARLQMSRQIVESRQIHVGVNANGEPERLATDGLTRLWLRDEKDNPIGKFSGRDGILWTREGRTAGQMLQGMGIDFLGSALALVDPLWPEDVIQVLGPAAYETEGDLKGLGEDVEKATAEQGLLIYAAWRYGRLTPFLIQGLGDVRIRGRLQDNGSLVARGNRGFTLLREMGTGILHGAMGEVGGEDGHRFLVRMDRSAPDPQGDKDRLVDVVEGRGWIRFSGNQVPDVPGTRQTALSVGFHAGLKEELSWKRTEGKEETRIDRIKSSRYWQDGGGRYGLLVKGIPLRVTATEEDIEATAETCEKENDQPWILKGQIHPVKFDLARSGKGSRAHLEAKELRFRRIPVLSLDPQEPILLPLRAIGKVRLEVDFPEDKGKQRRLELDCGEFRYLPIVVSPSLEGIAAGMFGVGGRSLSRSILGNRGGVARAIGDVELQLSEVGGERGRDLRKMFGEDLLFEADTFSSRMLPKAGGLVRVEIEEERRERLWARAEVARTHGADMELGARNGGRVEIWLQDRKRPDQVFHLGSAAPVIYRSDVGQAWVTPEDCGETPGESAYEGRYGIVSFPGPVQGKQLHTTESTRFEVSCSEQLVLQLRTAERTIGAGKGTTAGKWMLPQGFDRLRASGEVRLLYPGIEARGDTMALAGESGWFRLSSRGSRPVLLGFGDDYHAKYHPGIAYNLRTGEERAGRFLYKSGPIPAEVGNR